MPFSTPDRKPGPALEEELQLEDNAAGDPAVEGAIRYDNGDFKAKDSTGVFNLRSGTGLSEEQHKSLRQLIHLADGDGPMEGFTSGAFKETLPTADPFPTSIIWWESSSKLNKIVEKTITYTGAFPTTIEWKAYDTDGTTVLVTVTDSINYSGPFETDRTRTVA